MLRCLRCFCLLSFCAHLFFPIRGAAQLRDGGIDPWNLGKGDWVYSISDATNKVGGRYNSVTNENSLMLFYKQQGIRYMIVKAATGASLFNGCYGFPQFNSNLVNAAHANGVLIFGYNRSYATNVAGELAVVNYVFNQGADGFVWDAEAEWESSTIGSQGPSLAWQQCSTVRSNYPNKFLAHAPFPIIYLHSSFPYKEFGFWCDAVMPQIYHFSATKGSQSAGINWSDINWRTWQNSLASLPPTNIGGVTVYWTNSIKPLAPINDVYGPFGRSPCEGTTSAYPDRHVAEFMDYLIADPMPQTVGGYKGVSFWRTDLHGTNQWTNIRSGTSGNFTGIVNNIVMDNARASFTGQWISITTWSNSTTSARFVGEGTGWDTNSFGTNYMINFNPGAGYAQFTPNVISAGNYDVYEWHPSFFKGPASTGVPVQITYLGGSTNLTLNQRTNGGDWTWLGRFPFGFGTNGNIRISAATPEPISSVAVDGIKLAFAGAFAQPPPAPPSGLTATVVSTSRVDLVWHDNSTNETGFILSRATNSGGPYADLPALTANTTNYSDTGLSPHTTYYYIVHAFNDGGSSSNSAEASATTLALSPLILVQPASQNVFLGQSVTFNVSVGGAPFAYQWRFNAADIPGATASSFSITAAALSNSGLYSVFVTNAGGTALSSNAALTVQVIAALGDNSFGQRNVPSGAMDAIGIAAGDWHSLALRSNGTVLAWGNDFSGQCSVPASLTNAAAIAAGGYHSVAITQQGQVLAWGANDYGQCSVPSKVTNALAIAAGTWHSLALLDNGSVLAWGDNATGQSEVPTDLSAVVAIAARGNHSLALQADGAVIAWGDNTDSQGLFSGQSVVPANLSNVLSIAAGDYHSLAVRTDGSFSCWGDNSLGQCAPPGGLSFPAMLVGGSEHTIALATNGDIFAWGSDYEGQCDLPAGISGALAVAAGAHHSLVLFDNHAFAPRLLAMGRSAGQFKVRVQSLARKSYALEFKDTLSSQNWTPLATNRGNGALLQFSDPAASTSSRFYRVRQW